MPAEIDWDGLELAMDSGPTGDPSFFDTVTGQVYPVSDSEQTLAERFLSVDEANEAVGPALGLAWCVLWGRGQFRDLFGEAETATIQERVDAYMARFLEVPAMSSREGYADMAAFVDAVEDELVRERLLHAIDGRGAFRRFKDALLRYPERRQQWFDFRDRQMRQRAHDWLVEQGILDEDE